MGRCWTRLLPIGGALAAALLPFTVGAQSRNVGADNIAAGEAAPTAAIDQIGAVRIARPAVAIQARPAAESRFAPGRATDQLNQDQRNVAAPGSISSARESRGPIQTVIGGHDRCDSAAPEPQRPACRTVIESRASEFARPESTLISPESALLEETRRMRSAAQLGTAPDSTLGVDPAQRSNQEVASIVLAAPQAPSAQPTQGQTALDPANQAIVNAIVQSVTRGN